MLVDRSVRPDLAVGDFFPASPQYRRVTPATVKAPLSPLPEARLTVRHVDDAPLKWFEPAG